MYNYLGSIPGILFNATMNLATIQFFVFFVVFDCIHAQYHNQNVRQKTFPLRYHRFFECETNPLRDVRGWVVDLKSRVSVGPFAIDNFGLLAFNPEMTVPLLGTDPILELRFYFQCGCVGMYKEILSEKTKTIDAEYRSLYPFGLKKINVFDHCKNEPVPWYHCFDEWFPRKHQSCTYQTPYA